MKFKIERLNELKKEGIKFLASVVAKHFNTTYYHVVSIDNIIVNGCKWIPCRKTCHTFKNGGYKLMRTGTSKVDWNVTELRMNVK